MNIGIDVDGVLVDMEGYQLKHGMEYFAKAHNKKIINPAAYDIEGIFECTHEEREEFWKKYIWSYCLKEPVIKSAPEVISKLRQRGHKIFIITSRAHTTEKNIIGMLFRGMLKYWLKKNDIIYDDIVFCSEKDSSTEKRDACMDKQIDIMIDDKPENLFVLSEKIHVICYPAVWNKTINNDFFIRVNNWDDIYARIVELEIKYTKEKYMHA